MARIGFLEDLEERRLLAAPNLFFPPADIFPSEDLREPPLIQARDGKLEATLNMVRAGLDSDPILYGGEEILSSPPDPNSPNNPDNPVYVMAYQVDAYGESLPAQYPGPIFQLDPGETLDFRVFDDLAPADEPPNVVFQTNLHTHGLHVNPLNNGDNVYREVVPGEGIQVTIPVPEDHVQGVDWYHVHRHGSTHEQVYGGLSGLMVVGDPLAPWPEIKDTVEQVYMALSEVNIQDGHLVNYLANIAGPNFTTGWQKRINGQVNPTLHLRPGETQVWHLGSIGPFGGYNFAITDDDLANPWDATLLVQDGNGEFIQPYSLELAADPARMQDLAAATLVAPGNRLSMAVTAPTTPGTYYLIDGWGGQEKPAVTQGGQQQFYVLATIEVAGEPVTETPVFGPVGEVNPLFFEEPDVNRTFEFSIDPGATPAENLFLINGKVFGEGEMPQLQVGTVEEWTLTNPTMPAANANHPFHIHQGDFIVTEVNGVPVDPAVTPPPSQSSLAYITGRDVIDIPTGGSITIRFKVLDFPGKYVFHCHILKHEDQGMMSPVLAFGPAEGLRMPFGTQSDPLPRVVVLNGEGDRLSTLRPFAASYRGPVATASALGASQEFQTMVFGTAKNASTVKVYRDGSLFPAKTFAAFRGKQARGGVSLAAGALGPDGGVLIAAGSKADGPAIVRLFGLDGRLLREFRNVLPGRFPTGVNVATGDINGDNFDDLVISAGQGRDPIVTALDGEQIANGAAHPDVLLTFRPGGGRKAGAKVAVGYVAPSTVPSYQANLITTPETGANAGTVEVWNLADLGVVASHSLPHGQAQADATTTPTHDEHATPTETTATPIVSFRPFGTQRGAVQLATNYLGLPGVPVIASWKTPFTVAFSSIDENDEVTTEIRQE